MALEGGSFLPRGRVPEFHRVIKASRGQGFAIVAERQGGDPAGGLLEGGAILARIHVPQLHLALPLAAFLITTGRGQGLAVGTEGYRSDIACVARELDS